MGYRAEGLLTLEYRLPGNKYPEGPQQWEFHRRVVERVREVMADRFWPGQDPVGRTLRFRDHRRDPTIVGVVGDVKHDGLDVGEQLQVYLPQPQNPHLFNTLVARTSGDPMAMAGAVRAAVWSVDPDQPVWKVRTLESLIERALGLPRFLTWVVGAYSGLAMLLAAVGLYGVMAYAVERRTREIGVRVALGAVPGDVMRLVLRNGLRLTLLGLAAGLLGALGAGPLMRRVLFGVGAHDPATLAAVSVLLLAVAVVACLTPARRAARADPLEALRHE